MPIRDTHDNQTITDPIWDAVIPEIGLVALSEEFVKSKGLPEPQRWPWDHSKGIYLVNAYHNVHCLVSFR